MHPEFDEVVRQHQAMVLTYVFAIVRDRDLADDLLQETFLSAYRQGRRLGDIRDLPAWLRAVARNHALTALSRRRRQATSLRDAWRAASPETQPAPEEVLVESLAALEACREKLPDQQKRIVALFYDTGQSADQIAGQLGLTEKTVYQTLWIARGNLRDCIVRRVRQDGQT